MKRDPLVEILKGELERKRSRNRAYSLRSFSRDLEMDVSNLSKIMNYQLAPGQKLKRRLADKIGLSSDEIDEWACDPKRIGTTDRDYNAHTLETFEVISQSKHYAILELFKLRDFRPTPSDVADKLQISIQEATEALLRLQKVGLLRFDSAGILELVDSSSSSILNVSTSKAHREQQREILEDAILALDKTAIEDRSQSSMTMAIDSSKLEEARILIKKFRREMGRLLSDGNDLDRVYQLSISLYPASWPASWPVSINKKKEAL